MDSNHRRRCRQIYSLFPLATREPSHLYKKIGQTIGAGDWNRTRNLLITNQLLCQLSYTSKGIVLTWCLGAESNHRHRDFQSLALPTELPRQTSKFFEKCLRLTSIFHLATRRGLEPLTSSVTGWRTNQLYYRAVLFNFMVGLHGLEPRTNRL